MNRGARLLTPDHDERLTADVAIVGTGAGALAVAGELARHGVKVLALEAGPALDGPPGRHRRNVVASEAFDAELSARLLAHANAATPWPGLAGAGGVHAVGGMMAYWSNAVPRPDLDLEWDGIVAADIFTTHLERAERLMWATDRLYEDGSPRQRWIQEALAGQFGAGAAKALWLAGRRSTNGAIEYAGGDNLLAGAKVAVDIAPGIVVRRVAFKDAQVEAFDAVRLCDGAAIKIEADVFVIAAGAIGTPQLMAASEMHEVKALGRYLTDHLNLVTRVLLRDDADARDAEGDPPVGLYLPISHERPFHTGILDIPSAAHAGILAGADDLRTTDIGCFVGTEPIAENRLVFDPIRRDAFGLPAVSAEVRLTPRDHESAARAIATQYSIAATIGEPWRGMTPMLRPFGSSLHLMGTHRMGRDPTTSVATPEGRVWGFSNLYLAGNGILHTRNSCNPTLTTIAAALMAADSILGKAHAAARS